MIKAENYGKITENYRNLPEKSLKNAKNLPPSFARRMGEALPDRGGGLPIFSMTGGFWLTPLWSCLILGN